MKLYTKKIELIDNKIAVFDAQISILNKEIEKIENDLIIEAKVIGTTLSMFHSQSKLYSRKYDVVIIDEVTMAILPQIFFVSSLAQKKIIIVGDFYQLQSIVKTRNNNLVNKWIKEDIFRKNNIVDGTNPKLNKLLIQRRMNPAIAEITNQSLYNNILQHDPVDIYLEDEVPVSFYNTANFSPYATIPGKQGRVNVYNAILAVKLAQKYYLNNLVKGIGIISPYRKQSNLISKLIRDLKLFDKITADVVHKFQGLEKDVIIFDITDGYNTKQYRIGANLRDQNESPYLFNVSFTRAKKKLIVIGDLNYLRTNQYQLPNKVKQMLGIITHSNNDDYEVVDSVSILDSIILNNESPAINFVNNDLRYFTDQNFYQDFLKEISKCEKAIKIHSPFIAKNRVKNNFPNEFLSNLLARKIDVRIFTRPINQQPQANRIFASECIDQWQKLGVRLRYVMVCMKKFQS